MRMTEVITKLREVNPAVQEEMGKLVLACGKAKDLTLDADRCATDEGRKSLVGALVVAVMQAKILCDSVASKLLELDAVERSYTRKFESSGASALKLKEDPNQPCLPGLEPGNELAPEDPKLSDQDDMVDWIAQSGGMQSSDRHANGLTAVNNNKEE